MPRYIDVENVELNGVAVFDENLDLLVPLSAVRKMLQMTPTADVVEVVRCKDCKYRNTPVCKMWYHCVICGDYHHWERDEYYCSCGERK